MKTEYTKMERRQVLQKLVEEGVGDQLQMLEALKAKGIETTQATISRDLQTLGYVKIRVAPGEYRYEKLEKSSPDQVMERLLIMLREFVVDTRSTMNQIVVKTLPGNATGVARVLDEWVGPEVLGTVAGDDTLLIIVDNEENRRRLESELQTLLEGRV